MNEPEFIIEECNDPSVIAKMKASNERGRRNDEWLQAHWGDLMPQARGKFVAVAGQEAFIADTATEAWNWAKTVHPEDDSATVQYVRTEIGPRIYAHRR